MPDIPQRGPGPLDGVRVLDLTRVLAGPHCTRMLADLGADVIKAEPPEGDTTRFGYPRRNSMSTYFVQQNTGKRNISLDMRSPRAVELMVQLAAQSDVVVENFRPGVLDRMGMGYDVLAKANPRVILASISGYGQTGPWRGRRAYAPVIAAEAGLTQMQAEGHGGPARNDPLSHADVYTGLELLSGILAALYQREKTGRGQWVEVSMAETMLSINDHAHWELRDDLSDDGGDDIPSFRPGEFFVLPTVDGREVVVSGHPADKKNVVSYCTAAGRTDLLSDPRFATIRSRRAHLSELHEAISAWSRTKTADEIEAALGEYALAVGLLRNLREIADTDWAAARGAIVAVPDRGEGVFRVPNSPWHFSGADTGLRGQPAYRGEDNRSVFTGLLGLSDADVDALEAEGVLSSRVPKQA